MLRGQCIDKGGPVDSVVIHSQFPSAKLNANSLEIAVTWLRILLFVHVEKESISLPRFASQWMQLQALDSEGFQFFLCSLDK